MHQYCSCCSGGSGVFCRFVFSQGVVCWRRKPRQTQSSSCCPGWRQPLLGCFEDCLVLPGAAVVSCESLKIGDGQGQQRAGICYGLFPFSFRVVVLLCESFPVLCGGCWRIAQMRQKWLFAKSRNLKSLKTFLGSKISQKESFERPQLQIDKCSGILVLAYGIWWNSSSLVPVLQLDAVFWVCSHFLKSFLLLLLTQAVMSQVLASL